MVRKWNKNLNDKSGIKLETRGLKINCLAFADDIALLANNWDKAEQQATELEKPSAKMGLKISYKNKN